MTKKLFLTKNGFTLVELAIVMIIIGLLIGGILKGQELVESARVSAAVSQIKGIDAAISTFRDKYQIPPGDMPNPDVRLPGCAAAAKCKVGGDGNGVIAYVEANYVEPHLAAADLTTGYDLDGSIGIPSAIGGPAYLPAKTGNKGILWTQSITGGAGDPSLCTGGTLLGPANIRQGIAIFLHVPTCPPALTPSQAYRIDAKLDDGSPGSGSVRAQTASGVATPCGTAAQYNETAAVLTCNLFIEIQR